MIKWCVISIVLLFALSSCHKEKGNSECVWPRETTGMSCSVCKIPSSDAFEDCSAIASADSIPYQQFQLALHWETEYLSYESCSSPRDSIVGNIAALDIICLNNYNATFHSGDTLNTICTLRYLSQTGLYSAPLSLNNYLNMNPLCTSDIRFFLSEAPSIAGNFSFEIAYRECDGSVYSIETSAVTITP